MKFITLFTAIICSYYSFSQFNIQGNITDTNNTVIDYNVYILNAKDSSFIIGDYFNENQFKLGGISQKNILVKISALDYQDTVIAVSNLNANYDLGIIILTKYSSIDEVVITANRPIFERIDGNTIVNVENTMLSSSASVLELLTKTPSVRVEDNLISLFGKGEALLYLNGKQITFERLGSIPVSQIIKIEVISNPSAKYDAQGRAVINILTRVNTQEGFSARINENATFAKHFLQSHGLTLNYTHKKLSLTADYGLSLGVDWNSRTVDRTISSSLGDFVSHNETEENTRLTNVSNYKFGLSYDLTKSSNFSIQYDGLYNRYDLDITSMTKMQDPNGDITTLDVPNQGLTINKNNSINVNYTLQTDTLGSNLFIGGQYNSYNTKLYDLIDEKIYLNDILNNRATRVNDGLNQVDIITAQIDYLKVFKNNSQLEIGGKYANVRNDGKIEFRSQDYQSTDWVIFPQFTNSFLYSEDVPATYAQYSISLKEKWRFSAGVRSELSIISGYSRVLEKKVIDTTYFNLFPAAKLTYSKSDDLVFSLSLSSRINRPRYQSIDPFVWYNDSLTSSQGNPYLVAEKSYSTEFQTTFKTYSFKVGYTYSLDPIKGLPITGQTGPNSIIYSTFNLKNENQVYCSLEIPIEYKFFYSYNSISGSYDQLNASTPGIINQSVKPQLYVYSYNQFTVKNYFKFDLQAEYTSPYSNGITKQITGFSLAAGVSKTMLNRTLFCRVMVNDMFKSYYEERSSTIGVFNSKGYEKLNTFYIRINVVYKFGRLKEPNYKNKTVNDNEFNRV